MKAAVDLKPTLTIIKTEKVEVDLFPSPGELAGSVLAETGVSLSRSPPGSRSRFIPPRWPRAAGSCAGCQFHAGRPRVSFIAFRALKAIVRPAGQFRRCLL